MCSACLHWKRIDHDQPTTLGFGKCKVGCGFTACTASCSKFVDKKKVS